MSDASDISKSRVREMEIYLDTMSQLYDNAIVQNGDLYDIACKLTENFSSISAEAILSDSRIIKILRYSIAPSISQMKLGQIVGRSSVDTFESAKVTSTRKLEVLETIAGDLAAFFNERLDATRFAWKDRKLSTKEQKLSSNWARNWTCSLIADANAQTKYRNWRKQKQEAALEQAFIEYGYVRSAYKGSVITLQTDIERGEYAAERKVQGRGARQKADAVARNKRGGKLLLFEAKAVGVEIDAAKRVKECCNKAADWRANAEFKTAVVVALIGGFFTESHLAQLRDSNIKVVWEHRLSDLKKLM